MSSREVSVKRILVLLVIVGATASLSIPAAAWSFARQPAIVIIAR
jgi:hypothetical protein